MMAVWRFLLMVVVKCFVWVFFAVFAHGSYLLLPTAGRAPCFRGVSSSAVVSKMVGSRVELRSSLSSAAIFLAVVGPPRGLSLCGTFTRANHGSNMHEL